MRKTFINILFIILAFILIGILSTRITYMVHAEEQITEQTTKSAKKVNKKLIGASVGIALGVAAPSLVGMIFVYKKKEKAYNEARAKLIKQLQEQKAQEAAKVQNKDNLNTTL